MKNIFIGLLVAAVLAASVIPAPADTITRPAKLAKLSGMKGKHSIKSVATVQRQTYEVSTPVKVTGVRGADELKMNKETTVNDLVVNLDYLTFTEQEIDEFFTEGKLLPFQQEEGKKYRMAKWLVSEDEEIQTGEQTAQVLINTFKEQNLYCSVSTIDQYPLVFNHAEYTDSDIHICRIYYLNLLLQALAGGTNRPDLKYKIDIFYSDKLNAFTTPSGYMFISEEFLRMLDTEDELAAVVAHELSHITLRHHGRSEAKSTVVNNVMANVLKNQDYKAKAAAGALNQTLIKNSFSRTDEFEADKQAIDYLVNYGYNPFAFIAVLKKFEANQRTKNKLVGSFVNDHPQPTDRIKRVKVLLKEYSPEDFGTDGCQARTARFQGFMKFPYELRETEAAAEVDNVKTKKFGSTKKEKKTTTGTLKKLSGFLGGLRN